ncbi:hypothetical protein L915_14967, partial [Phytophthora nicotianae]
RIDHRPDSEPPVSKALEPPASMIASLYVPRT